MTTLQYGLGKLRTCAAGAKRARRQHERQTELGFPQYHTAEVDNGTGVPEPAQQPTREVNQPTLHLEHACPGGMYDGESFGTSEKHVNIACRVARRLVAYYDM